MVRALILTIPPALGAIGADVISGQTLVPVGAALGFLISAFAIGRRAQKMESDLKQVCKDVSQNTQSQSDLLSEVRKFHDFMITRPCVLSAEECRELIKTKRGHSKGD